MAQIKNLIARWDAAWPSPMIISRQYDNCQFRIDLMNYPEPEYIVDEQTEQMEILSYYLIVWMKETEDGEYREMSPIMLPGPYWIVPNYYTQLVQDIRFQFCVQSDSTDYEAHSAIFTGRIVDSIEHDGTTIDVIPVEMFDAYKAYIQEIAMAAGAVVIDPNLDTAGAAADAKAAGDAIKAVQPFVVQVPGSAAVYSGSITSGDFARALAAYTAGSGVYAVKDSEVYQLSAAGSATMTFTLMYHGTMNYIKQIEITSGDTFTATNTALSSSAADTSYSNTVSGLAATNVQGAVDELSGDLSETNERLNDLNERITTVEGRVTAIEEAGGYKRYGVSGVGQAASALTRIWDSVGMTAQVGTDGDNSNVLNDFDNATPFNRRKCVGRWGLENGRAVFRVSAYLGDADYAEDGSMGDYVAVECPRAYYYLKNGVLGISAHQYPGWRPFDIFCHDHNPQDTMPYYYIPAYALAVKDGHAVSLPGLDNLQGDYGTLTDAARSYAGDAGAKATIMPAAVNFYTWAMMTVEFATQNMQNVMSGCTSLRHSNDDHAVLRSDGKWLLNNWHTSRVVGEYVSIQPVNVGQNDVSYYASHKITSIIRCDESGAESSSGGYALIEAEDLGLGREYVAGTEYGFVARPYRSGECNSVSTPSGSPVNNINGLYPCKYRWQENPYGNQYKTAADLFAIRTGDNSENYGLDWYYSADPTTISDNPTQAVIDGLEKLDVSTPHENYVNGYIKSKQYSRERPDIWIPGVTTGGSASTYFADYASLVYSHSFRSCRFGGAWGNGSEDGLSYFYAIYAPSNAFAPFGADLFILQ